MKTFDEFLKEDYRIKLLPEMELEELVPEKKIFEEFEKFGYDAYDVVYSYDNLEISVSPKSYALDGGFGKHFSQEMEKVKEAIGADDFYFTATFQVIFKFFEDNHPELVRKY